MKKTLTILLICANFATFAQTKLPDTTKTVPLHFSEVGRVIQQLQRASAITHKLDISALKRDSIDMYLNDIYFLINRRAESVYADTTKKPVKKDKSN